ncbi:hypothetical protein Leryth_013695 [Lithospermum erythrorhizon]|nr:hypothetical protein Leryth_013695 [Lithospermum erythrorhizon]
MRAYHNITIFLFIFLSVFNSCSITQLAFATEHRLQDLVGNGNIFRRILHQPLFPDTQPPPSSPPPPSASSSQPVDPDQPFFPEVPGGATPDQSQLSPPPPTNGIPAPNHVATQSAQQSKPIKKVAIVISVGIVTLGMLSAFAFYLYKHKVKNPDESQKLVGENSQRINEESRMPPSTFLYIGTVEPSNQRSIPESNEIANDSPYRKLSSAKRSERYRPSPDLQPLPPLTKPPPPPPTTGIDSPPPMSSSDEESRDTAFYTPQGSIVSNEEGYYIPKRQRSKSSNGSISNSVQQSRPERSSSSPIPHSKRTSPKSRLASLPPDVKPTIIPSIKQSSVPPPPLPPRQPVDSFEAQPPHLESHHSKPLLPYVPKRPKFSAPPPPPDMKRIQSINDQTEQPIKGSVPPPPPPPPPPLPALATPRKTGASPRSATSIITPEKEKPRSSNRTSTPKTTPQSPKRSYVEEVDEGTSSLERHDSDEMDGSRPKLKPLHWDKVKASSDRATVWDQLSSSSFQLNEDKMESLFGFNSANSAAKETTKKSVLPPVEKENRVLDPKKSQNIAILLRALNVTRDEVSEALQEGNPDGLGPELLETLVKMAPTKEEEIKLKDYNGDTSKLGSAERFLKAILDVPFAFKRVEAMLYRANFDTEVTYLRNSYHTLEAACTELKNSRLFLKLLEAVLRTGNRMNVGTNRGDAKSFKLDTLLKLVDIKGTDGKTTLLHFVVQEIIRSEGTTSDSTNEAFLNKSNIGVKEEAFKKQGLQIVSGLTKELINVKKAAGMDSDVLHSYVTKLEIGLEKVKSVFQYQKQSLQGNFFESMTMFLKESEQEIARIKAEERKALSLVRDVTEYFHGNVAKEEAHPFRIFMIVRDFLSNLDNVCKEVGRMQEKTIMGSAKSFRIPATASLPVLNRYNVRHDTSSDDESSSL